MSGFAPSGGTASVALLTRSLSKRYGGTAALSEVSLCIPSGSIAVLVGENGSGKSTLLRSLLNLERPTGGEIEIFGLDVSKRGAEVRALTGYVPEHRAPGYRWMTCGQLIRHVAAFYPAWDEEYADYLVMTLGVRLEHPISALSKGEARKLQWVLALAHRPPLMLLDEPFDGLDPVAWRRTLALLVEHLADGEATVLIATHRVSDLETLADHTCVLQGGRLIAEASRDDLRRRVRRYRITVPDGWRPTPDLRIAAGRRNPPGRQMHGVLIGEESDVAERLRTSGARVEESVPVEMEEAVLAILELGEAR